MPDLLDDVMARYMAEQEATKRSPLLKQYQSPASRPAGVIGQSVYPYDGTSVLKSLETHGNRALAPVGDEIKEWTPPKWQDQAGDWLSQKLMDYGMPRNAAVSDANRISSLLGFLPPIAAHDGGVDISEGYRSGDYGQMGAGAIGVAGAALPFAGRALSRGASAEIKSIPTPPTPWGSTDAFLDKIRSAPQPYVHPLNVPTSPKVMEPMSAEASRAQERQLIDEARQFMTPSRDQDQAFRAFGTYEGKRYMSPTQELDDALKARNTPGSGYSSYDPNGYMKTSGLLNSLAKDLERHSARNEHIPAISERAQAMADRARSVAKTMDADEATRLRNLHMKWDSTDKYVDDAYRFKEPTQVRWLDGDHPFVMDDKTLHDILRHNYGANYADPESWPAAYKKFWADERAMRAAGKPTWHALEARKEAVAEADYLKRETGVDAFKASKEEVEDALTELRSRHQKYIDDLTSRLDAHEKSLKTPETSLADAIKRQAVPATLATGAVLGGQAAHNAFLNYKPRKAPQAAYPVDGQ